MENKLREKIMRDITRMADEITEDLSVFRVMKIFYDYLKEEVGDERAAKIVAYTDYDVNKESLEDQEFLDHCIKEFARSISNQYQALYKVFDPVTAQRICLHIDNQPTTLSIKSPNPQRTH